MSDDLRSHRVPSGAIVLNCAIMTYAVAWALQFNVLQILVSWIVGPLVCVFFLVFFGVVASWDMLRNHWIKDLHFDNWAQPTTLHYPTWLLDKDERLWRRYVVFAILPMSVSVSAMLFDFQGGLLSSLFSTLLTFLLTVAHAGANRK